MAETMDTKELLRRIRHIEITAQKLVNEQLAGTYLSVFKGRGMSFDSVRQYDPGDEVRFIDWNVTARTNQPYVKEFVEERELNIVLVADASASMDFGLSQAKYKSGGRVDMLEMNKRELAALSAASIALAAQRNNDRVGLVGFSDRVSRYIPPKKGRRHSLRIVREVLGMKAETRATNLGQALEFVGKVLKRRSVIFVLTDMWAEGFDRALKVLPKKHDVNFLIFEDPFEYHLLPGGLIPMQDLETGRIELVGSTPAYVAEYTKWFADRTRAFTNNLRKYGIPFQLFSTDRPFDHDLMGFFRGRRGKWR